jgi:hypothetical protein
MANANDVLSLVLLGGTMGMVGQGARAIIGLKKRSDSSRSAPADTEDFDPSRLVVSLIIGFIAGAGAILSIGLGVIQDVDIKLLLALAAAGYAGTDFIEGFVGNISSAAKLTGGGSNAMAKMIPALAARVESLESVAGRAAKVAAVTRCVNNYMDSHYIPPGWKDSDLVSKFQISPPVMGAMLDRFRTELANNKPKPYTLTISDDLINTCTSATENIEKMRSDICDATK